MLSRRLDGGINQSTPLSGQREPLDFAPPGERDERENTDAYMSTYRAKPISKSETANAIAKPYARNRVLPKTLGMRKSPMSRFLQFLGKSDSGLSVQSLLKEETPFTVKRGRTTIRLKLAGTILCIYIALMSSAGFMFLGKAFVMHYLWVAVVYGCFLCYCNVVIAKITQRHFFGRLHKIVYSSTDVTLAAGDMPKMRNSVLWLPWMASLRDLFAWMVTNFIYCFAIVRPLVIFTHDTALPQDPAYWLKAFTLLTFPLSPLVLMAALLAYSAATGSYVKFFFRKGEYEQYKFALTQDMRRYLYIGLFGYTLTVIMFALNVSLDSHNFTSIPQALQAAKDTEAVGLYLLVVVWSLLVYLSSQEARTHRRLNPALEARSQSMTPMDKRCPKCRLVVGFGIDICPHDGTPLTFRGEEESFGSSYEFLEEIARGSMCVIYKARHRLLSKVVAIKMLDTHYVSDPHAAQRFAHEVRSASLLQHPNIVSCVDAGQFESQKLFLVMEYLHGNTLSGLIRKAHGGLTVKDCIKIFMQICNAMAYAHENKILHRDLKPGNVMVIDDNGVMTVKVLDFGIAKLLEGTAGNLTKTGDVFGTPDYMSPEQCLGQPLDMRTDIYSMGCLMYESLTGMQPAASDNPFATMYKQINEDPLPLKQLRPELAKTPLVELIVSRAMAKEPQERYGSFNELRGALQTVYATL